MTVTARMRETVKQYGNFTALDGVSLEIEKNRIHGLLGRNGAGKSTLLRLLAGHEVPGPGEVTVFGSTPFENADVLERICFVRESQKYPDIFAVRHALAAASLFYPNWDSAFADQLVDEFGLSPKKRIKKLSRGQLSAVGIIIGLASRAPLTIFDEPYLGLDAVSRQWFYDHLLADYTERPRTIVLSTHLVDEISDLLEHVWLIDSGRILIDEQAETLRSRAMTVTGPAHSVENFIAGYTELRRERLGGFLRVTLSGSTPDPDREELSVEPVSLQQLLIHMTQQHTSGKTPAGVVHEEGFLP